jgi:hypothetical protein
MESFGDELASGVALAFASGGWNEASAWKTPSDGRASYRLCPDADLCCTGNFDVVHRLRNRRRWTRKRIRNDNHRRRDTCRRAVDVIANPRVAGQEVSGIQIALGGGVPASASLFSASGTTINIAPGGAVTPGGAITHWGATV